MASPPVCRKGVGTIWCRNPSQDNDSVPIFHPAETIFFHGPPPFKHRILPINPLLVYPSAKLRVAPALPDQAPAPPHVFVQLAIPYNKLKVFLQFQGCSLLKRIHPGQGSHGTSGSLPTLGPLCTLQPAHRSIVVQAYALSGPKLLVGARQIN
jgi:hypothetical protein